MWNFCIHLTSVRESLSEHVAKPEGNPEMEMEKKTMVSLSTYMKLHIWISVMRAVTMMCPHVASFSWVHKESTLLSLPLQVGWCIRLNSG